MKRPFRTRDITPESVFLDRRRVVKGLCLGSIAGLLGCQPPLRPEPALPMPAPLNTSFRVGRPVTPSSIAHRYNNFYEFSQDKERVADVAAGFRTRPWTLEVSGEVRRPQTFDVDTLVRTLPLEERILRFRCVEAWAMVVPWTGFPLSALLALVEPTSSARFVRFISALDADQMPGVVSASELPWPYHEALRVDEAMNPLAFMATGVYGRALPPQHGAPIRMVLPWKYGFKGAKSVVRIELSADRPRTFWNRLYPREYGFFGNVEPSVPHPRWSQEMERMIDTGARVPSQPFNGYAEHVAHLY